jgi:hypothetical protein
VFYDEKNGPACLPQENGPVFYPVSKKKHMPVNSKKQGQGQKGKKGDDAKTKASKAAKQDSKTSSTTAKKK